MKKLQTKISSHLLILFVCAKCIENIIQKVFLLYPYSLKTVKKYVVVSFIKCNFGGYLQINQVFSFNYGKKLTIGKRADN